MNIKHGLVGGKINSTARVGPAGWNCCQRERKLAGPWEKPRRILSVEDDILLHCGLDWQALPYLGDLHLTRLWMTCGQFSVQTKSIRRSFAMFSGSAIFSTLSPISMAMIPKHKETTKDKRKTQWTVHYSHQVESILFHGNPTKSSAVIIKLINTI